MSKQISEQVFYMNVFFLDSSSDEMEAEAYQSDSGASWGDDKFDSDAEASAPDEEESDGD